MLSLLGFAWMPLSGVPGLVCVSGHVQGTGITQGIGRDAGLQLSATQLIQAGFGCLHVRLEQCGKEHRCHITGTT